MRNPIGHAPEAKAESKPGVLRIGGTEVPRGRYLTVHLPLARLYTYVDMHMSVHIMRGRRDGPTLFVSAAVHGDEIIGVEITRRLLRMKLLKQLRGTLIVIPVVNVYGFINRTRYLPDRRDLNRAFPGSASGSLASQLANVFMREIVSHCTHGIDLHTGSNHRSNLPQIRTNLDNEDNVRMAKAFGAPVILNANLRDGSLREAVHALRIPMLLYEAGEALRFDEPAIKVGLRGVLNVMRTIGQLPARKAKKKPFEPLIAQSSRWVRAPKSGMLHSEVALGTQVRRDDTLGIVSDPGGENAEKILSPVSGVVGGKANLPLVHRGDAVFNILRFKASESVETMLYSYEDELDVEDGDDWLP